MKALLGIRTSQTPHATQRLGKAAFGKLSATSARTTHLGKPCSVSPLRLHVRNVLPKVPELLQSGTEGHDLTARVLRTWVHSSGRAVAPEEGKHKRKKEGREAEKTIYWLKTFAWFLLVLTSFAERCGYIFHFSPLFAQECIGKYFPLTQIRASAQKPTYAVVSRSLRRVKYQELLIPESSERWTGPKYRSQA